MFSAFAYKANPVKFPEITRYDILKSFAVICMILDHVGIYFFTDEIWWRVIGRMSFPVWLFLIGYARSRHVGKLLIGGAIILQMANAMTGIVILPLNILWGIIAVRLLLGPIIRFIAHSEIKFFTFFLLAVLIDPWLSFIWEYGSLVFLFALSGHYWRNGFYNNPAMRYAAVLLSALSYIYTETQLFQLELIPLVTVVFGLSGVMAMLMFYLPKPGPGLATESLILQRLFKLGGRYTLEIYVIHLLLFKTVYYIFYGCAASFCLLR